jgi:hypothetical protein
MSQTTAESSGEREVVAGDWNNWIFCYYALLYPELTFFLPSYFFSNDTQ